jgi:hypothetical protein
VIPKVLSVLEPDPCGERFPLFQELPMNKDPVPGLFRRATVRSARSDIGSVCARGRVSFTQDALPRRKSPRLGQAP